MEVESFEIYTQVSSYMSLIRNHFLWDKKPACCVKGQCLPMVAINWQSQEQFKQSVHSIPPFHIHFLVLFPCNLRSIIFWNLANSVVRPLSIYLRTKNQFKLHSFFGLLCCYTIIILFKNSKPFKFVKAMFTIKIFLQLLLVWVNIL